MVIKSVLHIRISHLAGLPERIKKLLIIRQHQQPIMIRQSKEERIRILEVYMRTFSVAEVQRDFRIQFDFRLNVTFEKKLKDNITHQIVRISPDTLRKVMQNTVKRAQSCRSISGHHLKDIIFKK